MWRYDVAGIELYDARARMWSPEMGSFLRVDEYAFHDATLMLEGGADVRYVQEMLGHQKLSTTALYTRVSIRQLKSVHSLKHPGAKLDRPSMTATKPEPSPTPTVAVIELGAGARMSCVRRRPAARRGATGVASGALELAVAVSVARLGQRG
jgi:hypothetical protein